MRLMMALRCVGMEIMVLVVRLIVRLVIVIVRVRLC